MFGQHFTDTFAGRVFSQTTTPLGLALPIYTATTLCTTAVCGLPLWNPPSSGTYCELVSVDIDFGNGTTADYGSIGLMAGQVTAIGTATGCSALVGNAPMNGYLFNGTASKVVSCNTVSTCTVTAGTATPPVAGTAGAGWIRALFDQNLEAATGTPLGVGIHTYWFNGTLLVPPGVLIYLAGMRATSAPLYSVSLTWKEIPITG